MRACGELRVCTKHARDTCIAPIAVTRRNIGAEAAGRLRRPPIAVAVPDHCESLGDAAGRPLALPSPLRIFLEAVIEAPVMQ